MIKASHADSVRGVFEFITSLKAANQLGKVRGTAQGLEVEIIRQGWQGPTRSYRLFPNIDVIPHGGESYLVRSEGGC